MEQPNQIPAESVNTVQTTSTPNGSPTNNKQKIILGGTGVATFAGIIVLLLSMGFTITGTDDICAGTIDDPCISHLTFINPTDTDVIIENPSDLEIEFDREDCIESFALYQNGELISLDGLTFKAKEETKIDLILYKSNPTCTIKFNVATGGYTLDPYFFGVEGVIEVLNQSICVNESWDIPQAPEGWDYEIDGFTDTKVGEENFYCDCGYEEQITMVNDTFYYKTYLNLNSSCSQYVKLGNKMFDPDVVQVYCNQDSDTQITCDSLYDGNADGICQSGESCIIFYTINGTIQYDSEDYYEEKYRGYLESLV